MNNIKYYKIGTIILLSILLVTFTQCLSNSPERESVERKPSSTPIDIPKSEEQVLNLAQVSVGIRNHEQLLHTYAELTNISPTNASVVTVYKDIEGSLPTNNDVKVFSAANQVAITRLAAEFCSLLIDNASTTRSQIFSTFNIDTVTLTSVTEQRKVDAITSMMNLFWGEGLLSSEEFDAAGEEILILVNKLAVGEANSVAGSKKVFKGACTAILASAYVTLI